MTTEITPEKLENGELRNLLNQQRERAYGWKSRAQAAEARLQQVGEALRELTAVVRGECPSLLSEDSGGSAKLDAEIDAALSLLEPLSGWRLRSERSVPGGTKPTPQRKGRGMSEMPDDVFSRVGEISREAVRSKIKDMLLPASVSPDATQAVILGALAGAVECFVCAANEGTTRERLKEALRDVVSDFVDQAKDQLVAGVQ